MKPVYFSRCIAIAFLTGVSYCLIVVSSSSAVCGQEPSLADLQSQWSELDSKFVEKQAAIEAGTGDGKQLREEYRELVDRANTLIKKIKASAVSALKENPADSAVLRTILGIMLNDAEKGRDKDVLSLGDILIANKINPRYFEVAAKADRLSIPGREIFEELLIRQRETIADDLPRVELKTTKGDIVLELYENQAPNTVANFISLVEAGQFSDILFHRVLEGFMAQAGETKSDGSDAPKIKYTIACECNTPETRPNFSHGLSMAHRGKNTGAGQFFLTFSRTSFLDGIHTCFGRVIVGGDILDKIERTHIEINQQEQPIPNVEKDKIISAKVLRKRDHDYQPTKFGQQETEPVTKQEKPPADPNLLSPTKDAPADKSTPPGKKMPTSDEGSGSVNDSAAENSASADKEESGSKKSDSETEKEKVDSAAKKGLSLDDSSDPIEDKEK